MINPAKPDLVAMIEAMPAEQRKGALVVLDALSRPLTARELELIFRDRWLSKSASVKIATALQRFNIIAVVGAEQ